ncbi:MAG TPA: flavin reductase family protein [Lachnospiraceae bacterium]|nr:flavin reductase family protein [Lachnospiraceae bacterium]
MSKEIWKPGNMLYPVPVVLITTSDGKGKDNIITVAWAGTVNSEPPMVSISVRKSRYSHELLSKNGEFVVNLVNKKLVRVTDLIGVKSGRDIDKFKECGLSAIKSQKVSVPSIKESPVNIECKVVNVLELGSHDMFIGEVLSVSVDKEYLNKKGALKMDKMDLVAYNHGEYYTLGDYLGKFGYSVKKTDKKGKQ